MSNFAAWWAFCQLPNHDGRSDDTSPGDPPTRWGFTYPTWVAARRYVGFRDLSFATFSGATQADMGTLAQAYFWNRQGGLLMPSGVDVCVIDWVWTSGGAVFDIQRNLGVDVDGVIGPRTAKCMSEYGALALMEDVTAWRVTYYDDIGLRQSDPGLYRRTADCLVLGKGLTGDSV